MVAYSFIKPQNNQPMFDEVGYDSMLLYWMTNFTFMIT